MWVCEFALTRHSLHLLPHFAIDSSIVKCHLQIIVIANFFLTESRKLSNESLVIVVIVWSKIIYSLFKIVRWYSYTFLRSIVCVVDSYIYHFTLYISIEMHVSIVGITAIMILVDLPSAAHITTIDVVNDWLITIIYDKKYCSISLNTSQRDVNSSVESIYLLSLSLYIEPKPGKLRWLPAKVERPAIASSPPLYGTNRQNG